MVRVGFLQIDCAFGQKQVNLNKISKFLNKHTADLWVLPELFNTGYIFTSQEELNTLAEPLPAGETTQFLLKLAKDYQTTIVAGIAENDNNKFYNSAICVNNTGLIGRYRKIHLYDREKLWFTPGDTPFNVITFGEFKLGLMICFDWIFPEAIRSLALQGADIVCHPSNLILPYCQSAMITRCLENRVFAITANRIGFENRGGIQLNFTGKSEIVSPKGDILAKASGDAEEACVVEIDPLQARNKNVTPYNHLLKDRRNELYFI